ncbi:translation elongation factor Ts [Nannocystis punicea]|uniref:Elongation factor Ts n=1 Tax=Nannocystis punicea TaxID=2995304 RepID=A0ABY7H1W0_9BACT|nr:translation elongation factor Ts [Nannocystis poenicansa]WAS93225.1 translation elongation factor Ts [Nannocystis poenicansa]
MATITSDMIKDLRERTGAGLMDCKRALTEVDADIEKAVDYLRKKGIAGAAKKAGRIATEGAVTSYIHMNHRVGVLLEVNCETDFVAKTADFQAFCADVAMQIAAMNPACVRREDMDTSKVEAERALLREKALAEGKPEKIVDKIVDGQVGKFYSEHVLLEMKWVKDDKKTIELLQQELVAKLGENIKIRRFTRYELGEGLEKKSEDFAAEVAAQIKA